MPHEITPRFNDTRIRIDGINAIITYRTWNTREKPTIYIEDVDTGIISVAGGADHNGDKYLIDARTTDEGVISVFKVINMWMVDYCGNGCGLFGLGLEEYLEQLGYKFQKTSIY